MKPQYYSPLIAAVLLLFTGCETLQKINPLNIEWGQEAQTVLEGVIVAGTLEYIDDSPTKAEQVLQIVQECRAGLEDGSVDLINFKRILANNGLALNQLDPKLNAALNLLLLKISYEAQDQELSETKLFQLNDLLNWAELTAFQYTTREN